MYDDINISLWEISISLSSTIDMVEPSLVGHHKKVAYIALSIGRELGITQDQLNELFLAAIFHDIGAFSLKEKMSALNFDFNDSYHHANIGYKLLRMFKPFKKVADIVHFHHIPWKYGNGLYYMGYNVHMFSHIIHLSDRVAILINHDVPVLSQKDKICHTIDNYRNNLFNPEIVDAFLELAKKEYFWLDITSNFLADSIKQMIKLDDKMYIDMYDFVDLSTMFSKMIDFRSKYTSTHSSGVAACAKIMAKLAGFSETECTKITIAANLHDLGKLAIPSEILNKPSRLSSFEYDIIKGHPFYTYKILSQIEGFSDIAKWASFHHEHLDGTGYPFHLKGDEIPLVSRIVAISDLFVALIENRPYRAGMDKKQIIDILKEMAKNNYIDADILELLIDNFDYIKHIVESAQIGAIDIYSDTIT